jgi:hypothetical protein
MGFTLRSFPLSQGIRTFPSESTHLPFSPPVPPSPKATTRPGKPRLLGFAPCESPLPAVHAVNMRAAGCSPGVPPFQGSPAKALPGIPPGLLSRTSPLRRTRRTLQPVPQSFNRPSLGLSPQTLANRRLQALATLLGFLHRPVPDHSSDEPPGIWVHLSPRRTLLPTDRRSLGGLQHPAEAAQDHA